MYDRETSFFWCLWGGLEAWIVGHSTHIDQTRKISGSVRAMMSVQHGLNHTLSSLHCRSHRHDGTTTRDSQSVRLIKQAHCTHTQLWEHTRACRTGTLKTHSTVGTHSGVSRPPCSIRPLVGPGHVAWLGECEDHASGQCHIHDPCDVIIATCAPTGGGATDRGHPLGCDGGSGGHGRRRSHRTPGGEAGRCWSGRFGGCAARESRPPSSRKHCLGLAGTPSLPPGAAE